MHPFSGSLLLPKHGHPRIRVLHQQSPAGAFRGFGVCQSEFALESAINLLAEQVGISPWEIRCRNAIEPGKVLPNGQIADCSAALKETLLAVKDAFEQNPGRAGIAAQKAAGNLGPAAHQMMKLLSEQPAKLFGMYPRKGALSVGSDADIVILSEILALAEEYGYLPIPNPGAEEGQSVSLRLGLSQLLDMDGVHLVEADDPKELQDVDTQVGQVVLEVGAVSVQGVQYHVGGTVSDPAVGHINGVLRARAGVHLLR